MCDSSPVNIQTKKCSKCDEIKPINEFRKTTSSTDGLSTICKTCVYIRTKKHIHRLTSSPKIIIKEKQCRTCKKIKPIDQFNKVSQNKDSHSNHCKSCEKIKNSKYIKKYKEKQKQTAKIIVNEKQCCLCKNIKPIENFNKNYIKKDGHENICKTCFKENYEKRKLKQKINITHQICRSCNIKKSVSEFHKSIQIKTGYSTECKSCKKIKAHKHYIKNKAQIREKNKKYDNEHKKQLRDACTKYRSNKLKTDPNYKILMLMRGRIYHTLKNKKSRHTMELVGCSMEELKEHLQQTAINNGYKSFNINNYSGRKYHIDHIIPCEYFDLNNIDELNICFHYSNLQILSAKTNILKGTQLLEQYLTPELQIVLDKILQPKDQS